MESLPLELIFEILIRTSLETLEECKLVSKSWNEIISEPTFLPLHSQRTNSLFGYFFQTVISHKFCTAFVSTAAGAVETAWPDNFGFEILASCDQGIFICERQILLGMRSWHACKPATDQWQLLPDPDFRHGTKAVAVVVVRSQPLRYLIARLSEPLERELQLQCEIFDSERWRWEEIDSAFAPPYGESVIYNPPALTIAGRFVHWLTKNDKVLKLDVRTRRFECSSLPKRRWTSPKLVEYKGRLGFVCEGDRRELELWTKETGELKKVELNIRDIASDFPVAVEFCGDQLLFLTNYGGSHFYDMQNSSLLKVEVPHDLRSPSQVFRFRSDTQNVDLKPTRRW